MTKAAASAGSSAISTTPTAARFPGCPRLRSEKQITRAQALGFEVMMGVEAEFYIFQLDGEGKPTTRTHDRRRILRPDAG